MKYLLSIFLSIAAYSSVSGQAFDFTENDIDGIEHHFYGELEPNKVAILFFATTWSTTSWNVHNTNVLQDIYETYGPNGKDVLVMYLLESDYSTTLEDVLGTGNDTKGDWTENANYPIFNLETDQIPSEYNINSAPTIKFIDTTRTVVDENLFGLDFNVDFISALIDSYYPEASQVEDNMYEQAAFILMPNPVQDVVSIYSKTPLYLKQAEIYDMNGRPLISINLNRGSAVSKSIKLDLSGLSSGSYVLKLYSARECTIRKIIKT